MLTGVGRLEPSIRCSSTSLSASRASSRRSTPGGAPPYPTRSGRTKPGDCRPRRPPPRAPRPHLRGGRRRTACAPLRRRIVGAAQGERRGSTLADELLAGGLQEGAPITSIPLASVCGTTARSRSSAMRPRKSELRVSDFSRRIIVSTISSFESYPYMSRKWPRRSTAIIRQEIASPLRCARLNSTRIRCWIWASEKRLLSRRSVIVASCGAVGVRGQVGAAAASGPKGSGGTAGGRGPFRR